jgi:hypothetical protein
MDYRGVLLIGAVVGAGTLAMSTACTGPDPGSITFVERPRGPGEPQASSSGTSGTASSGSAGDGGGSDAGVDPVFGSTPFGYTDPGVTANASNVLHANTVKDKDCMVAGCHADGNRVWVFGGTLYTAADGATTVAKGEIKIVGPNGAEVGTTYTDADGNFWLDKAGTTIPAGSMVAVRREGGAGSKRMLTALQPTDNGCSKAGTCHGGSAGKVFAP